MSRLRSEADMKPKMRMTCNPAGKGHWLTNWLEWYLLPDGLPDPDKCGKTRYFTMKDNEMIWGDSEEELKESMKKMALKLIALMSKEKEIKTK